MNGKTYRFVLCYRLGIPLFSVLKPCSTCSRVFTGIFMETMLVSAGKKVDIGLDGERDKPLHFVPGRAVIDVAQHRRVKYMAKCATIGYGFLPYSFSSLGELEDDAVTLLKRIRNFSLTRDIGVPLLSIYLIGSVLLLLKKWGPG
ncbi:hypothetical protein Tco_1277144 [Tanacetum coccineum]